MPILREGVEENKNSLKIIKIKFTNLIKKKTCLHNTWKLPTEAQGSIEERLSTTALRNSC